MVDTLDPGSPAARLVLYFRANPDEHLSRQDVAIKLGITPAGVDSAVEPAVLAALITVAAEPEVGRIWRRGPLLKHLRQHDVRRLEQPAEPVATPAPAAPPARQAKPATDRRGRAHLPALDLSKLPLRTDVPPPIPAVSMKGRTRHDELFDSLSKDGMSVGGVPIAYQGALLKAAQVYLQRRPLLAQTSVIWVRRIDEQTCGVWRMAKPSLADAPPSTQRKAARLAAAA